MQPLSIGIIGYGGFGQFVHRAWSGLDDLAVIAVADSNPALRPDGVRFYTRWQDLLADPAVDIVSIVTPPASHAEMACVAMEAGKHVLIEKPLAINHADAERIMAVQARMGRVAAVDYMLRFNPIVEAIHAWARSGVFGRLRRVVVENYAQDESLPGAHWFWDPAQSGGILVEHAVHFIDVVNGCTQARPVHVEGLSVFRSSQQEDRMMATVVYEDGLVASHYHAFSRPGFFEETTQRFVFDLAQIEVHGWIPLAGTFRALITPETERELARLPGFEVRRRAALDALPDESRPEGWGDVARAGGERRIRSGGESYEVEALVEGAFVIPASKSEAYAAALGAMMADVAAAIHAPGRQPRASLEVGLASLDIALAATEQAHTR